MAINKLAVIAFSVVLIIGGILNPFGGLGCGLITLTTGGIIYFSAGQVYAAPTIAILGYEFYAYRSGNKLFSMLAFVASVLYFAFCLIFIGDRKHSNNDNVPRVLTLEERKQLDRMKALRKEASPTRVTDEGEVFHSPSFSAERARIQREQREEEERMIKKRFG